MINTQLFQPLNMAYIGVTLIAGLYFFRWMKRQVDTP